jgi:heme-degrading monooxygenase HmoA
MIQIVWEFIVQPQAVARFREVYGENGDWAVLFRRYPGYGGTTLLEDTASPRRFLTIDRWESESHFDEMHRLAQQEYARLDALCEGFTISERKLGVFRSE